MSGTPIANEIRRLRFERGEMTQQALADTPRSAPVAATPVFDEQLQAADEDVQKIIAANLGRKLALAGAVHSPVVR